MAHSLFGDIWGINTRDDLDAPVIFYTGMSSDYLFWYSLERIYNFVDSIFPPCTLD